MKRVSPLVSFAAGLLIVCMVLVAGAFQLGKSRRNTGSSAAAPAAASVSTLENSAEDSAEETSPDPVITLSGEADMTIESEEHFIDPGCTAVDAQGSDLTSSVTTESNVDQNTPGNYTVTYSVTDRNGRTATATRNVHVTQRPADPTEKVIYLTFDDGPSEYTQKLLDVLDKYDVKVTFFVTNAAPDYQDMIAKEYEAGHSIAIHTYTHDYDTVYASEEAYFDDLNKMQDVIVKQTGVKTHMLRFPGGSSNTVSDICPGLMTLLTEEVQNMGFQYYDWNVSSGDAGLTTDTSVVYENVISGIQDYDASVVLQHDSKGYSVDAVEDIIKWGLENGYTFLPLHLNSPAAHHPVNN